MRHRLGPIALMLLCPPIALCMWYTMTMLGGSFAKLGQEIIDGRLLAQAIWPVFFGSKIAWSMIGIFGSIQLAFMRLLPGKPAFGPITPHGHTPVYKANGGIAFVTTMVLFLLCSYGFKFFSPTIIYDHFGELLGALNCFSCFLCLILYFKRLYFPTSSDVSVSGNVIFDYYWGTELYPRILGFDVKLFTNCRFGMMGWGLTILSFAAAQHARHGLSNAMVVAVFLQLFYLTTFFIWEMGYMRSIDIMHDRAGFYLCWGCLVWIPAIYTSPILYLVDHPHHLSDLVALLIASLGAAAILVSYLANRQRQIVRELKGECLVWGRTPLLTKASFTTTQGEMKETILLASGYWGISRHFHYIPEIVGAFCWSVPALFTHFSPYFYVVYLTLLLIDRAFRDEKRCREKYGPYWEEHCKKVPYKIIPYIL